MSLRMLLLTAVTLIWAAGVHASRAAEWLNAPADHAGRVQVLPDLTIPGHPDIFAIGDTIVIAGPDGKPVRPDCCSGERDCCKH